MSYIEHIKLGFGDLVVAGAAADGSPMVALHGAALVPSSWAFVAIAQARGRIGETAEHTTQFNRAHFISLSHTNHPSTHDADERMALTSQWRVASLLAVLPSAPLSKTAVHYPRSGKAQRHMA